MAKTPYTSQYRKNRAIVLAGNPLCVYCRLRPANTVDHVIELDRGGSDNLDNLVPACRPCNYRKGAQYGNAKRSRTARMREQAVREQAPDREALSEALDARFLADEAYPGPPSRSSLPRPAQSRARKGKKGTGSVEAAVDRSGFPAPRFETRWAGDLSWGLEAVDAYERFRGVTLMPWQRYALCAQLAQVDGRLVHRTSLVTLPRQQGKTVAMGALILWWTTIYAERTGRPENVILVGHMLKTLEQVIMRDMGNRMVEQFDAKFFRSSGRMEIELPNGSRIWAIAANDSAGHGLSASLVVADELWDIDADVVDQAIMPTQSAQPMPLFSAWSTAGTEASTLMLRYRQLGLDAIDKGEQTRNLFLEWSAPPSADLHDPAVWAACNPAWGHTVNAEEVEAEARLEWQSFLRKRLNLWVSAQNSWLEPGTWEDLVTTEEPSGPLKVLAVDSSPDGSRIVGVGVWPLADDRVLVAPCFTVTSEREAWREIRRLLEPSTMLAITPGLNGHTPPELQSRTTQVGYGELAQWTSPVINRIIHGTVAHHGEQLLTDHVSRAVAVTTKDGLVLSTQKSPGPIELARCAVWAIYLATKPARQARPAIGKATTQPRNWVL